MTPSLDHIEIIVVMVEDVPVFVGVIYIKRPALVAGEADNRPFLPKIMVSRYIFIISEGGSEGFDR